YIYDVNTNKILEISKDLYAYLKEYLYSDKNSNLNAKVEKELNNLKKHGFLKNKRIEKTEHPDTKFLKYYIDNKLSSVVLQVTQNCNLRCDYCIYSGSYNNRVHSNKRMNFNTAKKAVDYLIQHSKQLNEINISFYGGEPLLEFELIKKIVEYAKDLAQGKYITFNLTTNATLFTPEIVEYFVKHNITAMISLDGNEEIHDKSRVFASSGKGTHKFVLKNLQFIKENYPEYYKNNITFNTVVLPENQYTCIHDFVSIEELLKDSYFLESDVSQHNTDKEFKMSDDYVFGKNYGRFLILLSKLNIVDSKNLSPLLQVANSVFDGFIADRNITRIELPTVSHHSGPCLPGVYRAFITTDGDIYPCEKVSEKSCLSKIGTLDDGIDLEKASKLLNIGQFYEEKCFNCWSYTNCGICIAKLNEIDRSEEEIEPQYCDLIKYTTESNMKDYCVLKSLGYQY
ncbi:Cys-rich peptide radical SAM maturase CcpM, partial [Terrisporobacter muris]